MLDARVITHQERLAARQFYEEDKAGKWAPVKRRLGQRSFFGPVAKMYGTGWKLRRKAGNEMNGDGNGGGMFFRCDGAIMDVLYCPISFYGDGCNDSFNLKLM
jgi:hypothetical protein